MAKATEFPAAVAPLGDRAIGLSVEVWWSPTHPYKSGLTGQTSQQLADAYEAASGKQWSMPLGFRHALFEVAIDALKRAKNVEDPASIRDAIAATDYKSIVGPVNFKTRTVPQHQPHASGDRPMGEGQEIPARPHQRRQLDGERHPCRRQNAPRDLSVSVRVPAPHPSPLLGIARRETGVLANALLRGEGAGRRR